MATVLSTLYPPLIDTFMPAFPVSQSAVVNFSLSPYNSWRNITKLHVSIVDQRTNLSVLKASGSIEKNISNTYDSCFINSIWVLNLSSKYFSLNTVDNTCQLTIPKEVLKEEKFNISNYYKIQLRFSQDDIALTKNITSTYLINQRQYFSEWSSICLIKAIPDITLQLVGYDSSNNFQDLTTSSYSSPKNFPAGIIPIAGNIIFNYETVEITDSTGLSSTTGYLQSSTKDRETLRSYQITVQNETNEEEEPLQSEVIFTYNNTDPNRIYWLADLTNAAAGDLYNITVNCTTKNQYNFDFSYYIKISNYAELVFEPQWTLGTKIYNSNNEEVCLCPDLEEDGQLKITITSSDLVPGFLYIKRATSLDNFKHWELLKCTSFISSQGTNIQDTVIDSTLGSLVRYKYSCQYQTQSGLWTPTSFSPEIVYPTFSDILLSRGDKQLAIRYNGQISNMTPVVNRVKIDTLGGKYPKFAENAKMNYKQFQISGMIIAESDFNRKFLNDLDYKEDMAFYDEIMHGTYNYRNDTLPDAWPSGTYGTYQDDIKLANNPEGAYTKTQAHKRDTSNFKESLLSAENQNKDSVIVAHDIYPTNNWWWERLFREEAIKWLNDGEPKLFRSMTEGNMVVMLMDISLTPNPQVGRRTYNFSATAYEIEDGYSLDVLTGLNIFEIQNDKFNKESQINRNSKTTISQITNASYNSNNPDLVDNTISDYYNLYYTGVNSRWEVAPSSYVLQNLKIQFTSKPQWYNVSNGEIEKVGNTTSENFDPDNYSLGYVFTIKTKDEPNPVTIFVNEKGYYQVPSNTEITQISLYDGEKADLNYKLTYLVEYNDADLADEIETVTTLVGQLSNLWYPDDPIRPYILNKYSYNERSAYSNNIIETREFDNWSGVSFDMSPYTLVSIKFKDQSDFQDYLIGRTGVYDLMNKDLVIDNIYIKGRRMFKVFETGSVENTSKKYNLDEWEFVDETGNNYSSFNEITNPQYNHVYEVNNKQKIYYIDGQWYDFNKTTEEIGLAKVPISGIINYKGDLIKKTYDKEV